MTTYFCKNNVHKWKNHTVVLLSALLFICCDTKNSNQIEKMDTISFRNCIIEYPVYKNGGQYLYEGHSIPNEYEYESARRKLAICLCEEYMIRPDDGIKKMILKLYHCNEQFFRIDTTETIEFDSIVSQRERIFDPTMLID